VVVVVRGSDGGMGGGGVKEWGVMVVWGGGGGEGMGVIVCWGRNGDGGGTGGGGGHEEIQRFSRQRIRMTGALLS
jgi:hypothetical protein